MKSVCEIFESPACLLFHNSHGRMQVTEVITFVHHALTTPIRRTGYGLAVRFQPHFYSYRSKVDLQRIVFFSFPTPSASAVHVWETGSAKKQRKNRSK